MRICIISIMKQSNCICGIFCHSVCSTIKSFHLRQHSQLQTVHKQIIILILLNNEFRSVTVSIINSPHIL